MDIVLDYAIYHLLSVIYHMLSALYRLISAIAYRRSYTAKSDIRACKSAILPKSIVWVGVVLHNVRRYPWIICLSNF